MDPKKLSSMIASIENRKPKAFDSDQFNQFAIFLPIIKIENELHVLFEVRAQQLRRQPGEICFPGGRIDAKDQNSQEAAIRETCEELLIQEKEIRIGGPLDYLISPGTIIYPYFGWINKDISEISPNRAEVESIFTVPISYLIGTTPEVYKIHFEVQPEKDFPFHLIPGGKDYNWRSRELDELFYYYEDKVIWGLTAKILKHFINLLN